MYWKYFEGTRLSFCTRKSKEPELDDKARDMRILRMMQCFIRYKDRSTCYSINYAFSELCNLFNTTLNVYVLDTLNIGLMALWARGSLTMESV